MPSRCLPLAATQKAPCLVSRARGGGYFSNDSSRQAGLPSPVISQPQGSNPRARGTTGRVAPVQLRACPAGTLDPCRLPVDYRKPPGFPTLPVPTPGSSEIPGGPQAVAVAPGKGKGNFPSTPPWKIPRLWLQGGSTAEAGLAWAPLELEWEPDVARHGDVYHAPCFPPCATAGSTSLIARGAAGTVARCLLAGICSCSQLRGVKSCRCRGDQCPRS